MKTANVIERDGIPAIKHALKQLAKIGGRLSVSAGKLLIKSSVALPEDIQIAIAENEVEIAAMVIGWGSRLGLPRVSGVLPLGSYMLAGFSSQEQAAWKRRADEFRRKGVSKAVAEWVAYLQLTDAWVDCLIEAHQPFLPMLTRRKWLEAEIHQILLCDPRSGELQRELKELEAWIDANVDQVHAT